MKPLLTFTDRGIFCEAAGIFIDPWKPVDKALITHAHSDHARPGSGQYLAHDDSREVLKLRLGSHISLQTTPYGKELSINGVKISLHPAGHIPGSAQIRLSHKGQTWVVSGDYKIENDGLTVPFEPVQAHHFITESTFGLPVFQWLPQSEVFNQINRWWRTNKEQGKASFISAYALGKAQRVLQNVDATIGPIYVHGAVEKVNQTLMKNGIQLRSTKSVNTETDQAAFAGSLIIAPGSAGGSSWARRFEPFENATVSGWMQIRGIKRRRQGGTGFILSDHADWTGLVTAIKASGAENIYVTHGYKAVFSRWLSENGWNASEVETLYEGESQTNQELETS